MQEEEGKQGIQQSRDAGVLSLNAVGLDCCWCPGPGALWILGTRSLIAPPLSPCTHLTRTLTGLRSLKVGLPPCFTLPFPHTSFAHVHHVGRSGLCFAARKSHLPQLLLFLPLPLLLSLRTSVAIDVVVAVVAVCDVKSPEMQATSLLTYPPSGRPWRATTRASSSSPPPTTLTAASSRTQSCGRCSPWPRSGSWWSWTRRTLSSRGCPRACPGCRSTPTSLSSGRSASVQVLQHALHFHWDGDSEERSLHPETSVNQSSLVHACCIQANE